MLEERLESDLKKALLTGDQLKVSTLRGLKSTILYFKVASGTRGQILSDEKLFEIIQKEAKKRQESAELYRAGGNESKALLELSEKRILDDYLPKQLDESEIIALIDESIERIKASGLKPAIGAVIGQVKSATAGTADGAIIARLVQWRLSE